jgi:hypothetical protein
MMARKRRRPVLTPDAAHCPAEAAMKRQPKPKRAPRAWVCVRCRKPITPGVNVVPFYPLPPARPKDTATTVYRFTRVEGSKERSALLTIPLRRDMVERKDGEEFSGLEKILIDVLAKALVREITELKTDGLKLHSP